MLVAIVDWSLSFRAEEQHIDVIDYTFCPKVTGPNGERKKMFDQMYHDGCLPPNFPVPAIRCEKQRALSMGLWRWYWYLKGLRLN